jgi:tripartite-type tricarboxylate transporter receptor subunit TctC
VPQAIVARLNREINKTLAAPAVRERLVAQGLTVHGGTPEQFSAHIRKEAAKWAEVVKRAGVKVD